MSQNSQGRRINTYSPEVVDQQVEDTENDDQHDGAELRLETNHYHHARHKAQQCDNDPPNAPLPAENKANEQEDEEDTSGKLEIHLAVFLVKRRQTSKGLGLADPGVGEHHEKATHDGEVAQEEIEVEDETVANCLSDHNANETADGIIGVFPCDYKGRTGNHREHIYDEEKVCEAVRNCVHVSAHSNTKYPREDVLCL